MIGGHLNIPDSERQYTLDGKEIADFTKAPYILASAFHNKTGIAFYLITKIKTISESVMLEFIAIQPSITLERFMNPFKINRLAPDDLISTFSTKLWLQDQTPQLSRVKYLNVNVEIPATFDPGMIITAIGGACKKQFPSMDVRKSTIIVHDGNQRYHADEAFL